MTLVGCASMTETYTKEINAELSSSSATLVITRNTGSTLESAVKIDGVRRCELTDRTFCIVKVEPGKHSITAGLWTRTSPSAYRTIGITESFSENKLSFVLIDTDGSGMILPLPGMVFVSAKGTMKIRTSNTYEFMEMRSYLKREAAF